MVVAFTGTSRPLTEEQERIIDGALWDLYKGEFGDWPTVVRTGAALGVDTAVYVWHVANRPAVGQEVYVPDGHAHNTAIAKHAHWSSKVGLPVGVVGVKGGYLARNDALVAEPCASLVAFPRTQHEHMRTGTWATIRRARKRGLRIVIAPLDGSTPWKEN